MLLRIHKEGKKPIFIAFLILLLINIPVLYFSQEVFQLCILSASIIIMILIIQFFYNPDRIIVNPEENIVYSPADGCIVNIQKTTEKEFLNQEMIQISIFMNLINVHLNRIPINGKVIYQKYHPGKYLVAFHNKSSSLNENNAIVIEDEKKNKLFIRQIAGFIARRIVSFVEDNEIVKAGNEMGFIRFGSRVDIYLPVDANIKVQLKEKVKAGKTKLAVLHTDT